MILIFSLPIIISFIFAYSVTNWYVKEKNREYNEKKIPIRLIFFDRFFEFLKIWIVGLVILVLLEFFLLRIFFPS